MKKNVDVSARVSITIFMIIFIVYMVVHSCAHEDMNNRITALEYWTKMRIK